LSDLAAPISSPLGQALSEPPPIEALAPKALRLALLGLVFLSIALALSFAMVMDWKTPDLPSVMLAFVAAIAGTVLSYLGLYTMFARPRRA